MVTAATMPKEVISSSGHDERRRRATSQCKAPNQPIISTRFFDPLFQGMLAKWNDTESFG